MQRKVAKKCLQFGEALITLALDVNSSCATPEVKRRVGITDHIAQRRVTTNQRTATGQSDTLDRLRSPKSSTAKSGNTRLPGVTASLFFPYLSDSSPHTLTSVPMHRIARGGGRSDFPKVAKGRAVSGFSYVQVPYRGL
jgi:hypothetical protein